MVYPRRSIPCPNCGVEFVGHANAKYCSAECRIEKNDEIWKERYHNDENYKQKSIDSAWRSSLKRKFGISIETYIEMLEKQNYRCAICDRHQEELPKRMAVDHNHDTGKVRGLLCGNCNPGIGNLGDSVELLRKAIEYLEENDGVPTE